MSSVILEILEILIQNQEIAGKFILKPIGEKTRGISSLQKNGIKSNPLWINITPKPKTSSLILEILKILIQNQVQTNKILYQ